MTQPHPVARLENVVKSYHGVPVLRSVDIALRPGSVHVLAGENGAGKSTLIRILAGIERLDGGRVVLDDEEVTLSDAATARSHGIAVVHQELSLVPEMTIGENLVLGQEKRRLGGRLDRPANSAHARAALARVRCGFDVRRRVGTLSTGQQQLVEIARALAEEPRVLILDEPTAALSGPETELLLTTVEALRADGLAVLYISHRMEEVMRLADEVTVLRDGQVVAHLTGEEIAEEERIVTAMVGRPVEQLFGHERRRPSHVRLRVDELAGSGGRPATFAVRAGEVLGIAGIVGAGRSELMHLVAGFTRASRGTVEVDGERLRLREPADAARAGIVLLPESRKEQGLFASMSIADNVCIGTSLARLPGGRTSRRRLHAAAQPVVSRLRVKATHVGQPVGELSGGNQQKVLLARCVCKQPKVLILDEPTRGVDIGARADIYRLVNEVAAQGVAVVVVSSDLPELLGLADRALVMRNGQICAELRGEELTEEQVMRFATGAAVPQGPPRPDAPVDRVVAARVPELDEPVSSEVSS